MRKEREVMKQANNRNIIENIKVNNAQIKLRQHIQVKQGRIVHGKSIREHIHHKQDNIKKDMVNNSPINGIKAQIHRRILNVR